MVRNVKWTTVLALSALAVFLLITTSAMAQPRMMSKDVYTPLAKGYDLMRAGNYAAAYADFRLPLWEEYRELIKGQDADLKNSAGKRHAHPIVGGMFLKEFVDEGMPWAHLDIAGPATDENDKVATGFGVRLLVDYLQRRSSQA